uniref:ADP,ATP carrier protein n=1 Tax=Pseudo-nitzschia australis TaxID=44445 RepID=A0A6V0ACA6_9STRA
MFFLYSMYDSKLTETLKQNSTQVKSIVPPEEERKKLVPLALMFFAILFNYTILRDTKDVLMVTAPKSGAEVIPFIKTYVNLPAAIGFTGIYASLTNKMEQKDVFYTCVWPFLAFFSIFALFIYPQRAVLHPHAFCDMLGSYLPAGFSAPLAIIRNWSFAVFYVMAEMWGSVVASLLFWGFANEVTTVDEAKKYYPLFGLFANVALIFSGQYVRWVSNMRSSLAPGVDAWAVSLKYLMGAVLTGGGVVLGTFRHMQKNIVPNLEKNKGKSEKPVKKNKTKMSMKDSAKFLLSSPYIRNLAMLVVSYGMCINIVEVSWKAKLKLAFPNPNEYSAFMGNFSSATGVVTLVMMLLGRTIFAKFGWRVAALITPINLGVTGLSFFALSIFSDLFAPLTAALGTTPLMLAVFVGAVQNILSKSAKYSLFDPCKEMAYIPLDQESKTKGKAAIDVIGNPLGKSGGALIQQILIFGVGSLSAATPVSPRICNGEVKGRIHHSYRHYTIGSEQHGRNSHVHLFRCLVPFSFTFLNFDFSTSVLFFLDSSFLGSKQQTALQGNSIQPWKPTTREGKPVLLENIFYPCLRVIR